MTPSSAVIVGAGPAGALLALLLARGGVPVTLIERHSDFAREFRGEGMTPSGMAAIRLAGLGAKFDRLPAAKLESIAMYADGRPFLTLPIAEILPADAEFIRILAQPHLLRLLVDEAGQFPNFRLRTGVLVRDVVFADGRVAGVRVSDGKDGDEVLAADYVLAADGRGSVVRRRLGLDLVGEPQEFDVVWCKVRRPPAMVAGRVYSFLLPQFFGLAFPTEDDHVQIGRIIEKGSYREFRGGEGEWYDRIAAGLPGDIAQGFLSMRGEVEAPTLLDVVCGRLPTWWVPGACLLGDAAHPMSPVGAQGINIALRDAVVAANILGPVLKSGAAGVEIDAAAARFQQERETEVGRVQAQQTIAPRRLRVARALAPVLRAVPDSWVAGLMRALLRTRAARNFIEGVDPLRLTFGAPAGIEKQ